MMKLYLMNYLFSAYSLCFNYSERAKTKSSVTDAYIIYNVIYNEMRYNEERKRLSNAHSIKGGSKR